MTTIYHSNDSGEVVDSETLTAEIETARKHLAAAIEAKGEGYVYLEDRPVANTDTCLYLEYKKVEWVDDGEYAGYTYEGPKCPSCLIGHVLVGMGIPFEKITEQEGDRAEKAIKSLGTFTSTIVIEALDRAQQKQDNPNGYTWGQAVEEFEAYINEHTVRVDA